MKKNTGDLLEVGGAGVKGGAMLSLIAMSAGWTMVEKTIFFGLIATGTALSPALIAAYGLGGVAIGASLKTAKIKLDKHKLKRHLDGFKN